MTAKLTADVVLFGRKPGTGAVHVLLIRRGKEPFKGLWALPGGHVELGDLSPLYTAHRELGEETGIALQFPLTYLGRYETPGRDPRGEVITDAYTGLLPDLPTLAADDDAADAQWVPLGDLANNTIPRLAFDHDSILGDALDLGTDLGWWA